ncbi:MFS transporter [Actinospica robiniae]|uniref:MFS transporter n=1 Tax=Actinospica robiniae TaxID=304901 RepID=UPI000408CC46|nr:MFS transporter [Actinospica robiniae]
MSANAAAPLRRTGFRLLVGGQLASNIGDAFYAVALPWYVLSAHGGMLMLGLILVAYGVPRTVLLSVGGLAADRWGPWSAMMSADAVRALSLVGLAVAAHSGPPRLWILIPIAVVVGAGEGFFLPGSFAIVPALLPDEELQAGNALASSGTELAGFVGPALGGALVALAGATFAFGFDAATFVLSGLTLLGVRVLQRKSVAAPDVAGAEVTAADPAVTTAGVTEQPATSTWQVLRAEPVVLMLLLLTVVANLGSGGVSQVALAAFAQDRLHVSATGYGALLAAIAGGALFGAVAAGQVRRARRPAILGSASFLLCALALGLVPYLGGPIAAGAALAVFGIGYGFGNIIMLTTFQRWAPPALIGRLTGLLMLASFGVFPLAALAAGLVAQDVSTVAYFPIAAGLMGLAVLAGLVQRRWRGFGADADADASPNTDQAAGLPEPELSAV